MTDKILLNVWKRINPEIAFQQGINECKGKLFLPTKDNKNKLLKQIETLKDRTSDPENIAYLNSFKTTIEFEEPHIYIQKIIWAFFYHLLKKEDIALLTKESIQLIRIMKKNINKEYPLGVKLLTYTICSDLLIMLRKIKKVDGLVKEVKEFSDIFKVKNMETFEISAYKNALKANGHWGRTKVYSRILRDLYGINLSVNVLENMLVNALEEELQNFKGKLKRLKKFYNVNSINEINDILNEKLNGNIFIKAKKMKGAIKFVVEKYITEIHSAHQVVIKKTPNYLKNIFPCGGVGTIDAITSTPLNVLFITPEYKFSMPSLIEFLVHEEFGHCVNFSNSTNVKLIEKLETKFCYTISEGFSVFVEWQFEEILKSLSSKEFPMLKDSSFISAYEFIMGQRRVEIFLRALGDIKINLEKQTLPEFAAWGVRKTGTDFFKDIFYMQYNPGYAVVYPIEAIKLKSLLDKNKFDRKLFLTSASSLGFPPPEIYEGRLLSKMMQDRKIF